PSVSQRLTEGRDSTARIVRAALSQLSYPPVPCILRGCGAGFPAAGADATENATESIFRVASARSVALTMLQRSNTIRVLSPVMSPPPGRVVLHDPPGAPPTGLPLRLDD